MQTITTIGFDIAKSVFQVHGVDAAGQVVIRRQLKRRHVLAFFQKLPPCVVGIEACATSHHWSNPAPGNRPYRAAHAAGLREAPRRGGIFRRRRVRQKRSDPFVFRGDILIRVVGQQHRCDDADDRAKKDIEGDRQARMIGGEQRRRDKR